MAISNDTVDQYVPVAVETLLGAQHFDFDLYFPRIGSSPLLYRKRDVPLADADLERLADSGVKTLLIGYADRSAYEQHLHAQVDCGGKRSRAGKYALLTGSARSVFESALRGNNLSSMVGAAAQFGTQLADMLSEGQPILHEMFDLMLHDYSTFTHSANVATYCVNIAQQLGMSSRTELAQIAVGALLHDIGKRQIPRRVLNAPRNLSAAEREVIQRHPQIGFEELSADPTLTWDQLMIIYQHHERIDGRGYPVGIVDDEINPWAKICAVADVFDALTSDRPYHSAISVAAACDFLKRRVDKSFDPEIVRCLTNMMLPA